MNITKQRWQQAQELELSDWTTIEGLVDCEWEEAEFKYREYIKRLNNDLHLNCNSYVLDVGCGKTQVGLMFEGYYFGMEPLASKLDDMLPLSDIVEAIAEAIPFKPNTFDLTFCRNVIDHTYNPIQGIQEMYRVTKPNGHMLLACYVYNPFVAIIRMVSEKLNLSRNIRHPHTYTMDSLEKLAEDNGFEIVERKIIYTGKHPHDFGKTQTYSDKLPWDRRVILYINKLLGYRWFVREYCLLCKKGIEREI